MLIHPRFGGGNYINGKWYSRLKEKRYPVFLFPSYNPADQELIDQFEEAREDEIAFAVEAARNAFPMWRDVGIVKRAEYLWRVARLLENRSHAFTTVVAKESGKQVNEARADVMEAFHMAQFAFAVGHLGKIGDVLGDEISTKLCLELLEPRGVVVSITPWNFPVAIPFWLIALPLVYGNTVILKPSEETPYCGVKITDLFHEAGIPRGVFQLLQGQGDETGWRLLNHPDVNVVLFTGSYEVGRKIRRAVAEYDNKVCTIETGSKSAVVVLKDADMESAVAAALASAFKTAGQRCVSGGRIIVERPIFDEFTKRFQEAAKAVKTGDPFDSSTYYGPMITKAAVEKGKRYNQIAREEGFAILVDRENEPGPTATGNWLGPFVYTGQWRRSSRCLTEEVFAPHVALIPANDFEDALRIYNDTDYGLSGSIVTGDIQKAIQGILEMECGVTYVNLPCIGAGVRMAFGGRKKSGNLIASAAGLLPVLTHKKAVTINYGDTIQMAQGLQINVTTQPKETG